MPRNLELKARIGSIAEARRYAMKIGAHPHGILHQEDQYYRIPHGRLKLRIEKNHSAELIYYNRPNKKTQRYSTYFLFPVTDQKLADRICTGACGKKVKVVKKRRLYLYKNARIHLDEVQGLGTFIEFEVIVNHGNRQAQTLLKFLSVHFRIKHSDSISGSYSDLIMRSK
jgi:predicted adenylyl cyclase CyaB